MFNNLIFFDKNNTGSAFLAWQHWDLEFIQKSKNEILIV